MPTIGLTIPLKISLLVLFHTDPIIINQTTNISQKNGVGGKTIYEINAAGKKN
jgi:hypothetical protein